MTSHCAGPGREGGTAQERGGEVDLERDVGVVRDGIGIVREADQEKEESAGADQEIGSALEVDQKTGGGRGADREIGSALGADREKGGGLGVDHEIGRGRGVDHEIEGGLVPGRGGLGIDPGEYRWMHNLYPVSMQYNHLLFDFICFPGRGDPEIEKGRIDDELFLLYSFMDSLIYLAHAS